MQNYFWLHTICFNSQLNRGILKVWFPPGVKENNPCFWPLIRRDKEGKQNAGVQKKCVFQYLTLLHKSPLKKKKQSKTKRNLIPSPT